MKLNLVKRRHTRRDEEVGPKAHLGPPEGGPSLNMPYRTSPLHMSLAPPRAVGLRPVCLNLPPPEVAPRPVGRVLALIHRNLFHVCQMSRCPSPVFTNLPPLLEVTPRPPWLNLATRCWGGGPGRDLNQLPSLWLNLARPTTGCFLNQ